MTVIIQRHLQVIHVHNIKIVGINISYDMAAVIMINCFKVYHRLAVPDKYRRVSPVCSGEYFSHKSFFFNFLLTQVNVLRLS